MMTDKVSCSNLPPPPPLPDFLFGSKHVRGGNLSNDYQEDEFVSLEKAVRRVTDAEKGLNAKPFHSHYTHLQSQLQDGPKCGLVALSIATSTTGLFKSTDELFAEAVNRGYTTRGEMYSCRNLADLINKTTDFKSHVIEGGIDSHLECIFHCIHNNGLMLVPYDADCNHSPCCRGGRSAHWAVVSGIVIFKLNDEVGGEEEDDDDDDRALQIDEGVRSRCRCVRDGTEFFVDGREDDRVRVVATDDGTFVARGSFVRSGRGRIFLAGKQGKSRRLALWPFDQLAESNWNLNDLSEQQRGKDFVLPEGGVAAGLKGKAILIRSRSTRVKDAN